MISKWSCILVCALSMIALYEAKSTGFLKQKNNLNFNYGHTADILQNAPHIINIKHPTERGQHIVLEKMEVYVPVKKGAYQQGVEEGDYSVYPQLSGHNY